MKKVAKVILYKNNKVLLQLRDDRPDIPFPNQWSLFGGRIEDYESAKDGLIREIKEELDATMDNIQFISKHKRMENDVEVEDHIYSAALVEDISELKLTEGSDMKLFSVHELEDIDIVSHSKKYILEFMYNIHKI